MKLHSGHILGAAASVAPLVALLANKAMAPLFIVAAVAVLALELVHHRRLPYPPTGPALALLFFIGLAAASGLWSITPWVSVKSTFFLAGLFLGCLLLAGSAAALSEDERRPLRLGLLAGGGIGFAWIAIDGLAGGAMVGSLYILLKGGAPPDPRQIFSPGVAIAAIFIWPWGLLLSRRFGRRALALLIPSGLALLLTAVDSPALALATGAAVFVLALWKGKMVHRVAAAAIVMGVVVAPAFPYLVPDPRLEHPLVNSLSNSAQHRLLIWRHAADEIEKRPFLGSGFDTARAISGPESVTMTRFGGGGPKTWYNSFDPIPLHTHNGVIQIWLELGGVGALLLLAFLLALLRILRGEGLGRVDAAAALGMAVAALFVFSVSFGAWQAWWLSSLGLLAAFMAGAVAPCKNHPDRQAPPDGKAGF